MAIAKVKVKLEFITDFVFNQKWFINSIIFEHCFLNSLVYIVTRTF